MPAVVTVLAMVLGAQSTSSTAPAPPPASCTLRVGPSSTAGRLVPRPSLGCHLDAGYAHQTKALSAEMVYGSAFGAMPDPPGPNASRVGRASFAFCTGQQQPAADSGMVTGLLPDTASLRQTLSGAEGPKLLRHCDSQLYATKVGEEPRPHPGDYVWQLRPSASHPGAITLHPSDGRRSAGIGLIVGEEAWRLGFGPEVAPLLFRPLRGLANSSQTSFQDVASGRFLTLSSELRGSCARRNGYGDGDGDAVLSNDTEHDAVRATWAVVPPPASPPPSPPHPSPPGPSRSGCTGWLGVGDAALDPTIHMIAGGTSMTLPPSTAGQPSEIINRGFAGEGLYLQASKPYDGFVLVLASAPAIINASLRTTSGAVLGSAIVPVAAAPAAGGPQWVQVNFTITPHTGTECIGISQRRADASGVACPAGNKYRGSINPAAHICVDCGGELALFQVSQRG
jgi:putative hemolysin